MRRIDIMGCPFDAITPRETIERIFEWRDAHARESHRVVTVDVSTVMTMRRDPGLARAVERADLVVADDRSLVWTSRCMGSPALERVSGVELMTRLFEAGAVRGLSVYLLGATDERLQRLQRLIFARYPTVRVAGARNGSFGPSEDWKVVRAIRRARADVLLVGMPAPFREVWCEEHKERLATPAIVGVGDAFEVLAGAGAGRDAPKAPRFDWRERARRFAMVPRRAWKRHLTQVTFLSLVPKAIAGSRAAARPQRE